MNKQDLASYLTSALEKLQHMAKGSRIDGSGLEGVRDALMLQQPNFQP